MAGKCDLTIEQNAVFRKRMRYESKAGRPINLTGYTAKLQMRAQDDYPDVLVEMTTENGGIVLGRTGTIALFLSLAQVSAINFKNAQYDLLLIPPNGEPMRLLKGRVIVERGVTRS